MTQSRSRILVLPALGLGLIATAAGVMIDGRVDASDIRSVGVGALVVGLGWLISSRNAQRLAAQVADVAKESAQYQLGRRDGYSEGYHEGRRIGRPTVVDLDRRCCGSCKRGSVNVDSRGARSTSTPITGAATVVAAADPIDSPEWEGRARGGLASPN